MSTWGELSMNNTLSISPHITQYLLHMLTQAYTVVHSFSTDYVCGAHVHCGHAVSYAWLIKQLVCDVSLQSFGGGIGKVNRKQELGPHTISRQYLQATYHTHREPEGGGGGGDNDNKT